MRIELSHRLSSGLALVLTFVLLGWALRTLPPGHRVRRGAAATAAFMVSEALIGAILVLFGLVAHDESTRRVVSICLHLTNTFLLLASTALTAWWASGQATAVRLRGQGAVAWAMGSSLAAMLLVGATGAVTALGDTLFPPTSLAAGLAQDLAPSANLFVRLRTLHPVLAAATAMGIVMAGALVRALRPSRAVHALSRAGAGLVVAQVAAGLLDVALLAPVCIQLVHLVLADALWVVVVLTAAASLDARRAPQPAASDLDASGDLA
jgi:heme A synthase